MFPACGCACLRACNLLVLELQSRFPPEELSTTLTVSATIMYLAVSISQLNPGLSFCSTAVTV